MVFTMLLATDGESDFSIIQMYLITCITIKIAALFSVECLLIGEF